MRKMFVFLMVATLCLGFAGSVSATPLKVGVVVAGALGDKSFYDSSSAGLEKAVSDFGIKAKVMECRYDPANYVPYLATAAKNFKLVFIVGFEFLDAMKMVAPKFPNTDFVFIDGSGDVECVSYADFRENEGSFLAGALAGLMTLREGDRRVNGQNVIGAVCGQDIPVIHNFLAGYVQGARHVNPGISVLTDFVGSWDDPAGGRDIAFLQHKRGADVIFQVAGGTGTGIIEAAKKKGFYVIGVDSPQEYLVPDTVLTSMVKRCDVAVYDLIKEKLEGTFQRGHVYSYGLKEGGVGLSWWTDETKRNIPTDIATRLHELERDIIDGKIIVSEHKD